MENVEDNDEVIVLKIENLDDENENYVGVEDEAVLDAVFNIFKDRYKDEFTFTDEN